MPFQSLPNRPFSVPTNSALALRLKALRGDKEVAPLARERGVSPPTIYKAESGKRGLKWPTLEAIYGDLCHRDQDIMELLMLWALSQTERQLLPPPAREALTAMVAHTTAERDLHGAAVLREMKLMSTAEQAAFARFAAHYRKNESTRRMAEVWVDSAEEWARQIR